MSIESNDTNLSDLLHQVETGKAQLPDFQRDWVWDDYKICKLIESITSGYPMGAGMFLQTGNESIRFTYRKFAGVDEDVNAKPEYLVLDGQQRLTTLFQVFKSSKPVNTCLPTDKNRRINRYYYLDIKKAIDPAEDRMNAIISIPESKVVTSNFGRAEDLNLATLEQEIKELKFPLNITFSEDKKDEWFDAFRDYYEDTDEWDSYREMRQQLRTILRTVQQYKIPIIKLSKETPKEAVCQIFENVNTGGVPLTVFELMTATFASDGYKLREDWESVKKKLIGHSEILSVVDNTAFLTAITLLVSFYNKKRNPSVSVSCKRKDVLNLRLEDYKSMHDAVVKGFMDAADFLVHQGVYKSRDLPYATQLIPLAAIFAYSATCKNTINLKLQGNERILSQWYWCGVLGELYGAANESRYALDIVGVIEALDGIDKTPDTVSRASFYATRLLSMHTRNSAAYKGVMALITKSRPQDFMSGNYMDVAAYLNENTDIHHIFPQAYCKKMDYAWNVYDSVVNKTPIYAATNRSIGGRAPSEYIQTMRNSKRLNEDQIIASISSHFIDFELLNADDFTGFIADRATRLLDLIADAMGKPVSGRDTEETIKSFGRALVHTDSETDIVEEAETDGNVEPEEIEEEDEKPQL